MESEARRLVPGSDQGRTVYPACDSAEGKQSRHTKSRVQSFEVVLRSQHRACEDVGEAARTQDGRGTMAVALVSRFWRLGCPKIYHEVATRLSCRLFVDEISDTDSCPSSFSKMASSFPRCWLQTGQLLLVFFPLQQCNF